MRKIISVFLFLTSFVLIPVAFCQAAEKQPVPATQPVTATVNINTADAQTLANHLFGIGSKRAAAIVAYRTQHGKFENIDQLRKVKGISPRVIEKNRKAITF
jgi:competence protein ComEA